MTPGTPGMTDEIGDEMSIDFVNNYSSSQTATYVVMGDSRYERVCGCTRTYPSKEELTESPDNRGGRDRTRTGDLHHVKVAL